MTKAEREELREGCDEPYLYIGKLLTTLDEKDTLIADLLGYIERIQWTAAEAVNIEKLKARAEK